MNDDDLRGVFHCFTGNNEDVNKIIALKGFYLGIGGVLTFKNSGLDKTIEQTDLKHIVLETGKDSDNITDNYIDFIIGIIFLCRRTAY